MHVDADVLQQPRDFAYVVAIPEAERGRAQQVAARTAVFAGGGGGHAFPWWRAGRWREGEQQGANEMIECLAGAPILLLRVGRQLQRYDGDRQRHAHRERSGLILNEFRRARLADQHGVGLEAFVGVTHCRLHELRRVTAEVPRLERGIGHRRSCVTALDHGEEQIRIRVALRRMQHVMHALHRGRDAHRAHVRRAFVRPERQFHAVILRLRDAARDQAAARKVLPDRPPARSRARERTRVRWTTWYAAPRPRADWRVRGRRR